MDKMYNTEVGKWTATNSCNFQLTTNEAWRTDCGISTTVASNIFRLTLKNGAVPWDHSSNAADDS